MLIKDRHKTERFEFPKMVFGPTATQEQVYASAAPELLEGFLSGENHALLFAYGQTGTGKTHTMFGTSDSLSSPTPHDDWGLLPRIVDATLAHLEQNKSSRCGRLVMSAIEFYCLAGWDLNGKERTMVTVTTDGEVYGHTFTTVSSVGDIAPFIERVYGNRMVRATKMNSGSSRSHVCIVLTLYQVDMTSRQLTQTEFTVVDLAGSERPGRTGSERVTAMDALVKASECLQSGKPLPIAHQGALINAELTQITSAIAQAADRWSNGQKYKPQTALVPPSVWYLGGCCTGHARLGVIVGISQSPQNGWETWFSCTWGENVAKLRAPCDKQKPRDIGKEVKKAQKEAKEAEEAVKKANPNSASSQKYALYRAGMMAYTQERLAYLEQLLAMVGVSLS